MSNTLARVSATSTENRATQTEMNSMTDQELVPSQQKECPLPPVVPAGRGGLALLVLPSQLRLLEECKRKRSRKENKK